MKKLYYTLIISTIALVSFFFHSSVFTPYLNSDDAVVVLMIHDFNLPGDLYYWDANRFGSLIPLIGQFFYKIIHLTPVQSEAISHYLLLILGFIGFASLFKSKKARIVFAIAWFLPPYRMIDLLKLSQGEQYAVFGIAVFLINKLFNQQLLKYKFKDHSNIVLCTLMLIISVWVSDLAIITICILLSVISIYYYKTTKSLSPFFKKQELYYTIAGFILGSTFIFYAKANAAEQGSYYSFFDPDIILSSFKIFLKSISEILLFKAYEPFTSFYTYLLLIAIFIILVYWRKIITDEQSKKWLIIFILDLIVVFLVLISSKWVHLNGVARRYFVCNYISFWVVFLILIDNLQELRFKNHLYAFLLFAATIGGIGTIYNYKYYFPRTLKPSVEISGELKSLGKIGIIANYWNSYLNSAADPDNIKSTPNDQSVVRKKSYVDSVFAQPKIYIIRDSWMDTYPDTLKQFGRTLIKSGEEFRIANSNLCLYKKLN